MGGEKLERWRVRATVMGSPPRGRGKAEEGTAVVESWRITPAWAGKSTTSIKYACTPVDHPRVGGEKRRPTFCCRGRRGSPPRGRGKEPYGEVRWIGQGITPAWAGKRAPQRCLSSSARDHPRVGGEKLTSPSVWRATPGSPPRGRGKGHLPRQFRCGRGITPAWAGKSCPARSRSRRWRDHPRVGGEKTKKIP